MRMLRTRWPRRQVALVHDVPGLAAWAVWSPRGGLTFIGPRRLLRAVPERGHEVVHRGEQRWVRDHLGPQATSLDTSLRPLD